MPTKVSNPQKPVKLTPKQEQFCREYLIDLNGTQAAIRAGYSEKAAKQVASRLLTYANVHARVGELKAKRIEKCEITAEFVLNGLKEVSQRCRTATAVMTWDRDSKSMVQVKDEDGKDVWQFDSGGANKALELLGKHLGLFEKDNEQGKQEIKIVVTGRKSQ